jgi:LysM repeat protein
MEMGFFDKLKNALGGESKAKVETVKGPSTVLREAGIDPSCVDCKIGSDGKIRVSGEVDSGEQRDRIVGLLKGIPGVSGVINEINVAAAAPEPAPEPGVEPEAEAVEPEAGPGGAETPAETGRTYTVESGDTLWKIAQNMYGDGSKYMKIFEANASLLDDPDKIFPGQTLQIPDLED